MNMPEQLETERLVLRKPRMEDALTLFHAYVRDPEITRSTTWRPRKNIDEAENFIHSSISAWENKTRFPFFIVLKQRDEPFGMIDLQIRGNTVGFGCVIARSRQQKGHAMEGILAIMEWAFQQQTMDRVDASTTVDNIASKRVLEKAGMVHEGLVRKYILHPPISDVPRDSYMYAITN